MPTVYVDNKKNVVTNITNVANNVATVEFFVDNELALTRPVPIPEQANGNTADPSFTNIVDAYARRLTFGAHIGLKRDETIKSVT